MPSAAQRVITCCTSPMSCYCSRPLRMSSPDTHTWYSLYLYGCTKGVYE
jgi:hypothetical protein